MGDQIVAPAAPAGGHSLSWHSAQTVKLAAPIIISRLGLMALFTVDTMMAGQVDALQLAGLALGTSPLLTLMLVSLGAMQATVVLTAQAVGRGDDRVVGDVLRAGFINALILGTLIGLITLAARPFFLAIGQDPAVTEVATEVAYAFAWGMPGQLLFIVANLVLEATNRPRVGMVIMLVANIANIALDGIFVFGWGGLVETGGAATAMATSSVVRWGIFLVALGVLVHRARQDGDRHRVIATLRDWVRSAVTLGGHDGRTIRRIGLPMGLGQGVESAAFATVLFFAGLLGTAVLAAHQSTLTVMGIVYMNAVGIGGAASIRVGQAAGMRSGPDLIRAGWSAISIGGIVSGLCGLVMIAFSAPIAHFIVDDPAAAAIATTTIWFCGFLVAFDAMMGVAMGALRGLGDVWQPLWLQSAAFWFVSVPVAYGLGIWLDYGAVGLFWGIAAGIAASLGLLLPRFHSVSQAKAAHWREAPDSALFHADKPRTGVE